MIGSSGAVDKFCLSPRVTASGHSRSQFNDLKVSLIHAINQNDHEIIQECLRGIAEYSNTIQINEPLTTNGSTALILAAENGHTDIVKLLVGAGADVNKADKIGLTALMYAVQDGHADIMKVLFKARADVNKADSDGLTALMLAAEVGHMDIVKLLWDCCETGDLN